jgi:hypothetical protein
MNLVMALFNTIPEAGRLALLGIGLISSAFLIRRILSSAQAGVNATAKADARAK